MHSYKECDVVTSNDKNHHTFKVRTTTGLLFMFQVSDEVALERWERWFKGRAANPSNPNASQKNHDDKAVMPVKMQQATFGAMDNFPSKSRRDEEYSSFYDTNIITTCQHTPDQAIDNSRSALYQQSFESSFSTHTDNAPMGNGTSFGVMPQRKI